MSGRDFIFKKEVYGCKKVHDHPPESNLVNFLGDI